MSPPLPSFAAAQPPLTDAQDNQTAQQDIDWYLARELQLGTAIRAMRDTIKAGRASASQRVAVQWGSVFDGAVRNRGLINFPCLASGIDVSPLVRSRSIWLYLTSYSLLTTSDLFLYNKYLRD